MCQMYLDKFHELERVSNSMAYLVRGKVFPLVQGLQDTYTNLNTLRHPKKAVAR